MADKKPLNLEELKKLMQFRPSLKMTAGWFDVSEDTIARRIKELDNSTFADFRDKHMAGTQIALIQKAITKALSGDNTMLIFSLKNLCGWKDKIETTLGDEFEPMHPVITPETNGDSEKQS